MREVVRFCVLNEACFYPVFWDSLVIHFVINVLKSLLVIDEPPMGSDEIPTNPEDNPISLAMT